MQTRDVLFANTAFFGVCKLDDLTCRVCKLVANVFANAESTRRVNSGVSPSDQAESPKMLAEQLVAQKALFSSKIRAKMAKGGLGDERSQFLTKKRYSYDEIVWIASPNGSNWRKKKVRKNQWSQGHVPEARNKPEVRGSSIKAGDWWSPAHLLSTPWPLLAKKEEPTSWARTFWDDWKV